MLLLHFLYSTLVNASFLANAGLTCMLFLIRTIKKLFSTNLALISLKQCLNLSPAHLATKTLITIRKMHKL